MVETGYENLLLVRLLLEMRIPSIRKSSVGISDNSSCFNLPAVYGGTKTISIFLSLFLRRISQIKIILLNLLFHCCADNCSKHDDCVQSARLQSD